MEHLINRAKRFISVVLYSSVPNDEKSAEYESIVKESNELKTTLPKNEADYVLSQVFSLGEINQYNVPVAAHIMSKLIERYNNYRGMGFETDVLITDLSWRA
jgi:hypothetical protein